MPLSAGTRLPRYRRTALRASTSCCVQPAGIDPPGVAVGVPPAVAVAPGVPVASAVAVAVAAAVALGAAVDPNVAVGLGCGAPIDGKTRVPQAAAIKPAPVRAAPRRMVRRDTSERRSGRNDSTTSKVASS